MTHSVFKFSGLFSKFTTGPQALSGQNQNVSRSELSRHYPKNLGQLVFFSNYVFMMPKMVHEMINGNTLSNYRGHILGLLNARLIGMC